MDKLTDLVYQANEYDGKVLFEENDVRAWNPGYIDKRTLFDLKLNLPIVKPVTYEGGFFNYICPLCTELHAINRLKVKRNTPVKTGCCFPGMRSTRMCMIKGQFIKIKAQKIILDY